jgi:hypothetical protein
MELLSMKYSPPPPPRFIDPASQPEYAKRLRTALETALLEAGQDGVGGIQVVRSRTAVGELIRLIAFAAYRSPDMQLPSRCRKWTEEFAHELRLAIREFQRAEAAGKTRETIFIDERLMEWPR